jgi:hypothetical protein
LRNQVAALFLAVDVPVRRILAGRVVAGASIPYRQLERRATLDRRPVPLTPSALARRTAMRSLVILAVALVMAGPSLDPGAARAENVMGLFFDDRDFAAETSRVDTTPGVPFDAYVVLLDAGPSLIGAYELGISMTSSTVTTLSVTGPNGWTNFGAADNHIAGYVTPVPASSGGTVLASMRFMQMDRGEVDIMFGPSSPSSLGGAPVIADGSDPEILLACELFGGGPVVAGLNVPPPERREVPFSHVKSLFQ